MFIDSTDTKLEKYCSERCPKLHDNWYLDACSKSIDQCPNSDIEHASHIVLYLYAKILFFRVAN